MQTGEHERRVVKGIDSVDISTVENERVDDVEVLVLTGYHERGGVVGRAHIDESAVGDETLHTQDVSELRGIVERSPAYERGHVEVQPQMGQICHTTVVAVSGSIVDSVATVVVHCLQGGLVLHQQPHRSDVAISCRVVQNGAVHGVSTTEKLFSSPLFFVPTASRDDCSPRRRAR